MANWLHEIQIEQGQKGPPNCLRFLLSTRIHYYMVPISTGVRVPYQTTPTNGNM